MTVLERLAEDIKNAMKAKDQVRLDVLRMVKTAAKNKEIELIRPLTEQEFIAVLSTLVKQRKDSIDQYTKANRTDLAEKEEAEVKIISEYLPKALSDEELKAIILDAVKKTGASGPQDLGKVMKEIKDQTQGRVDGKVLTERVKQALSQ